MSSFGNGGTRCCRQESPCPDHRETCAPCQGDGYYEDDSSGSKVDKTCKDCNGKGWVYKP